MIESSGGFDFMDMLTNILEPEYRLYLLIICAVLLISLICCCWCCLAKKCCCKKKVAAEFRPNSAGGDTDIEIQTATMKKLPFDSKITPSGANFDG